MDGFEQMKAQALVEDAEIALKKMFGDVTINEGQMELTSELLKIALASLPYDHRRDHPIVNAIQGIINIAQGMLQILALGGDPNALSVLVKHYIMHSIHMEADVIGPALEKYTQLMEEQDNDTS